MVLEEVAVVGVEDGAALVAVPAARLAPMRPRSHFRGEAGFDAARALTVEIANRSGAIGKTSAPAELPKIVGRPKS